MKDKYPRGKLNNDDEGETRISIGVQDKTIIISFEKPIAWVGCDKAMAIQMAMTLIKLANSIK